MAWYVGGRALRELEKEVEALENDKSRPQPESITVNGAWSGRGCIGQYRLLNIGA